MTGTMTEEDMGVMTDLMTETSSTGMAEVAEDMAAGGSSCFDVFITLRPV